MSKRHKFEATLGIDFGTTNSCIAYIDSSNQHSQSFGNPIVIPNQEGSFTTPTCAFFDIETKDVLFGSTVESLLHSSSNTLFLSNIITNVKRLLGISYDAWDSDLQMQQFFKRKGTDIVRNPDGMVAIQIRHNNVLTVLSIDHIIQSFMFYLRRTAEEYLGASVCDIVITVPAYFSDLQRSKLKMCCESAGLNVVRIINEPTAAALAYGFDILSNYSKTKVDTEHVLVIDCGGGTTDISVLFMDYNEQLFEVKNVSGDNFLGGEDITNTLVSHVIQRLHLDQELSLKQLNRLKTQCEKVKQQLSFQILATLYLECFNNDCDVQLQISRESLLNISGDFFAKVKELIHTATMGCCIDKVVMVGGTTRIPYISEICRSVFGNDVHICNSLDPDQTVSIGAAVQGYLLTSPESSTHDMTVIDVIPMSLGVEMLGGLMNVMVSKNSHIPISRTHLYTNSEDHITELLISIYQGERRLVKDNVCLTTFKLNGLNPQYKRGEMNIRVTFNIDSNGILTVEAEETRSNSKENVCINVQKLSELDVSFNNLSLDESEDFIFQDSYKSNQILGKLELYDTFKYLLTFYHEHKQTWLLSDFQDKMLNALFNKVFDVIKNFHQYTPQYLHNCKSSLEGDFHNIVLMKDAGDISYGSSDICDL